MFAFFCCIALGIHHVSKLLERGIRYFVPQLKDPVNCICLFFVQGKSLITACRFMPYGCLTSCIATLAGLCLSTIR